MRKEKRDFPEPEEDFLAGMPEPASAKEPGGKPTTRRRFLGGVAAGLASGLGHFVLLGGAGVHHAEAEEDCQNSTISNDTDFCHTGLPEDDICVAGVSKDECPGGYWGDVCTGGTDGDICPGEAAAAGVDLCPAGSDVAWDKCDSGGGDVDNCPASGTHDSDQCPGGEPEFDICPENASDLTQDFCPGGSSNVDVCGETQGALYDYCPGGSDSVDTCDDETHEGDECSYGDDNCNEQTADDCQWTPDSCPDGTNGVDNDPPGEDLCFGPQCQDECPNGLPVVDECVNDPRDGDYCPGGSDDVDECGLLDEDICPWGSSDVDDCDSGHTSEDVCPGGCSDTDKCEGGLTDDRYDECPRGGASVDVE